MRSAQVSSVDGYRRPYCSPAEGTQLLVEGGDETVDALVAADVEEERAGRLADLALAVLIGRQQRLGTTDVGELLALFDELMAYGHVSEMGRPGNP